MNVACEQHLPKLINLRIAGGRSAEKNEFPYIVSIQYEKEHKCGGSIIGSRTVLTAAHCIIYFPSDRLSVLVGTNTIDSGGIRYHVSKAIPHEHFDSNTYFGDIGIVKLKSNLQYSLSVQPIRLANQGIPPETNVVFSGWGNNVINGNSQTILQTVVLSIIPHEECKIRLPSLLAIVDAQICTFTKKGQGICQGDSGGPLLAYERQIGVASWGQPCAIGYPEIYTNIWKIMSDNNSASSADEASTNSSKKRRRNSCDWKVNKRKLARQEGREYVTMKGVTVPGKKVGPPCTCKRKCMDSLCEQDKVQILSKLYTDTSKNLQDTFPQGLMEIKSIERRRKRLTESAKQRNKVATVFEACKNRDIVAKIENFGMLLPNTSLVLLDLEQNDPILEKLERVLYEKLENNNNIKTAKEETIVD
ncbi:hypothetical protein RN001_007299 [Aquatica leii]|uniref:Peptidase S1 domain-containing protein n=1 Tax=Aquatica leii TaxID=1421715 RepID=A0AAN7QI82_9COLE|nr:hypothetical protein RN001_007299 [Aquatica leii]